MTVWGGIWGQWEGYGVNEGDMGSVGGIWGRWRGVYGVSREDMGSMGGYGVSGGGCGEIRGCMGCVMGRYGALWVLTMCSLLAPLPPTDPQ